MRENDMMEKRGKAAFFVGYYDKHPCMRVSSVCLASGRKVVLACLFRLSQSGSWLELS